MPASRSRPDAGTTAFHAAADSGHTETCALLLGYGAMVGAKDKDGWTPLHAAAGRGHEKVSAPGFHCER